MHIIRDIFSSILWIYLQKKIDMGEILKYPLTPIPLSLYYIEGTKMSTPKVALIHHLESYVITKEPRSIDISITDAIFLLYIYKNLPGKFGGESKYLLKKIF